MSIGPNRWQRRRDSARARRAQPVIHRCTVQRRWRGGYQVTIEGTDLVRAGVPASARVGQQAVTDLRVAPGRITGVVAHKPRSRAAVVDNGVLEARAVATLRRYPALADLARIFPRRR
ncbi:hypothetical protein FE374_11520 [Georgenia yuyongxinii]|uniref:Uncharacterized protein n=1 Tax=Georgenia yuyongxinii TaxID=2589797 RepID=A0A5B8C4N7_9MICO|nr:hypothetical protein [Georgenia yuyongxinii]QDC25147.1 hypothetical protein FE374_11520 [Georgenia yuyongxinii]